MAVLSVFVNVVSVDLHTYAMFGIERCYINVQVQMYIALCQSEFRLPGRVVQYLLFFCDDICMCTFLFVLSIWECFKSV